MQLGLLAVQGFPGRDEMTQVVDILEKSEETWKRC